MMNTLHPIGRRALALAAAFAATAAMMLGAPAAQAGTLERIAERGAIVIGYRDSAPPMSFTDAGGNPAGFSIDMCLAIAEGVKARLDNPGLAVQFKPVTAEDRVGAVVAGDVDIECGITTKTQSRMEQVDFTSLTFVTGATFLSARNGGVAVADDLAGRKVAVIGGTTTATVLANTLSSREISADIVEVGDHAAGLAALLAGDVAAYAADQVVLIGLAIEQNAVDRLFLSPELLSYEPYAFMIQRNDADFRLVADSALSNLYASGGISNIYGKWFSAFQAAPPPLLTAVYTLGVIPQ